jgi:hypothetical protein
MDLNNMHTDFRNEWLSKLGQRINIPELAFDDAGFCQLSLDDELTVAIYKSAEAEDLVVFGRLPVQHLSIELMQQMLMENRHHSKQNAPVISLSENLDAMELHYKLTQFDVETVDDVMGSLIGHLEYWRTNLHHTMT